VDALLIDGDGILAAGSTRGGSGVTRRVTRLARLTADGSLDRSFGKSGYSQPARPGDHSGGIKHLVPLPGGRLAAVGWATRGNPVLKRSYHFLVYRYSAKRRIDASFGDRGRVSTKTGAQAFAGFLTASGRLCVVGTDDNPTGRLRGSVVFRHYVVGRG